MVRPNTLPTPPVSPEAALAAGHILAQTMTLGSRRISWRRASLIA